MLSFWQSRAVHVGVLQRGCCAPASSMTGRATLSHTACACRAPPKGFRNTSSERGRSADLRMEDCTAAVQSAAPSPCCRNGVRFEDRVGCNSMYKLTACKNVRCAQAWSTRVQKCVMDALTRVWNLSVVDFQMYGLLGRRSNVWTSMQCICSNATALTECRVLIKERGNTQQEAHM